MVLSADFLLRRLRLRHLQLLTLLGEEGSLRAAAEALSLTQPAVSKMLHEIEQAFGTRLFERGRRGVLPNAPGQAAIRLARVVLGEVGRGAEELDAVRGGATAILRIGTLSITSIVPNAVVDLCTRLPTAQVQIREGRLRELLPLLHDGEIDCVFGSVPAEALAERSVEDLRTDLIFEDRLCMLVSERSPLAELKRASWSELDALRWVVPPRDTPVRQQFTAAFLQAGRSPPVPVVETLSPVTLMELLRLEPSFAGATRLECARADSLAGLRRLEPSPTMPLPPLCAITRRKPIDASPIVLAFVDALRRAGRSKAYRAPRTDVPRQAGVSVPRGSNRLLRPSG